MPLGLEVAGIKVRIDAPNDVLAILNSTMINVPRFASSMRPELTVTVVSHEGAWEIRGSGSSRDVLGVKSALPQVGGAAVSRAVADVADRSGFRTMRATVLERHGKALAMIGDDWESAITLATHMHGRGWRYVGCDHALFDPAAQQVHCVQKSLYIGASSVSQIPLRYRAAVEASPWYVTSRGVWFYAVDPTTVGMKQTWTSLATLAAVIVVDGSMTDVAALEAVNGRRMAEDRFTRLGIDWTSCSAADLRMGNCIDTCDLIEQWFALIRA